MISKSLIATALLAAASAASAATPRESADAFLAGARLVLAEVQQTAPDAALVTATIDEMLENAKPVVTTWTTLAGHTQCAAQLARVIELYPEIAVWTPQEIRRNIEGGAALPAGGGCYPARDVVAHPAIVRALSRDGITATTATRLTREMNEAVEHMEAIALELGE